MTRLVGLGNPRIIPAFGGGRDEGCSVRRDVRASRSRRVAGSIAEGVRVKRFCEMVGDNARVCRNTRAKGVAQQRKGGHDPGGSGGCFLLPAVGQNRAEARGLRWEVRSEWAAN